MRINPDLPIRIVFKFSTDLFFDNDYGTRFNWNSILIRCIRQSKELLSHDASDWIKFKLETIDKNHIILCRTRFVYITDKLNTTSYVKLYDFIIEAAPRII